MRQENRVSEGGNKLSRGDYDCGERRKVENWYSSQGEKGEFSL